MDPQVTLLLGSLAPALAVVGLGCCVAAVVNTWLRIKNGYPLSGHFGQALLPKRDEETMERVKLLSSENAQLRAELGSMKDRLATVERIVTDDGHRLTQEIESLRRGPSN